MGQGKWLSTIAAIVLGGVIVWLVYSSDTQRQGTDVSELEADRELSNFSTPEDTLLPGCEGGAVVLEKAWAKIRSKHHDAETKEAFRVASNAIFDHPECFTKEEAGAFYEEVERILATMSLRTAQACLETEVTWEPRTFTIPTLEGGITFQGMPGVLDDKFQNKHKVHRLTCHSTRASDFHKAVRLLGRMPEGDRQWLMGVILARFYVRHYTKNFDSDKGAQEFHKRYLGTEFNRMKVASAFMQETRAGGRLGLPRALADDFDLKPSQVEELFRNWRLRNPKSWDHAVEIWSKAGHDPVWVQYEMVQHWMDHGAHAKALQIAHRLGDRKLVERIETHRIAWLNATGQYNIMVDERGRRMKIYPMFNSLVLQEIEEKSEDSTPRIYGRHLLVR
jgi:hypothetical protein